jgi:hypothetical protein
MMGEMERINAIIKQKTQEKKEREEREAEEKRKAYELQRARDIASDPRAPEKYRAAYQRRVDEYDNKIKEEKERERLRQIERMKTEEYLKKLSAEKMERAKMLMKKYGKRQE